MTLFAPHVSAQLKPTTAAKLLQLLAFPSHALEKRGEEKTRRLSRRLLLRRRAGARLLPPQRCLQPLKAGSDGAWVETRRLTAMGQGENSGAGPFLGEISPSLWCEPWDISSMEMTSGDSPLLLKWLTGWWAQGKVGDRSTTEVTSSCQGPHRWQAQKQKEG